MSVMKTSVKINIYIYFPAVWWPSTSTTWRRLKLFLELCSVVDVIAMVTVTSTVLEKQGRARALSSTLSVSVPSTGQVILRPFHIVDLLKNAILVHKTAHIHSVTKALYACLFVVVVVVVIVVLCHFYSACLSHTELFMTYSYDFCPLAFI